MQIATSLSAKFRIYYRSLARRLILEDILNSRNGLTYWQNKLFAKIIFYALPFSLLALVPNEVLELREGHLYIAIFNMVSLVLVGIIAFHEKIAVKLRKILVAVLIVLYAMAMMAFMGSFTLGCIYLFPLSVFMAFQFSNRVAYFMVVLNFSICIFFALLLWVKPFNLPVLYNNVSLNHWLIYSFNFLFMDLVVVMLIRQLLTGLNRTMVKEATLYKKLQTELLEKTVLNEQLKESEEHYRTLFFQSPLPKWIFDPASLRFLQVNAAAIKSYGYAEQEFLQMKLSDLHDTTQVSALLNAVETSPDEFAVYVARHLTKDGREIDVEIRRSDILFKGKKARLVIATDITERVNYIRAAEVTNRKLREIAYMQSHIVRAPLANIIGIVDLMAPLSNTGAERELIEHLQKSVKQLDLVVSQIIQHTEEVLPDTE